MFRPPNDKLFSYELRQLEKTLNKDKEQDDRVHIDAANYEPHFQIRVERDETPNEARLRWQSQEWDRNSHHSSIVTAVEHSRRVTAYDLAVGAGWTASNRAFFEFLCLVADWRVDSDKKTFEQTRFLDEEHSNKNFFNDINPDYQKLIRETWKYAHDGILPAVRALDGKHAPGVISRTNGEEHMAHRAKIHSRGDATSYPLPGGKR